MLLPGSAKKTVNEPYFLVSILLSWLVQHVIASDTREIKIKNMKKKKAGKRVMIGFCWLFFWFKGIRKWYDFFFLGVKLQNRLLSLHAGHYKEKG